MSTVIGPFLGAVYSFFISYDLLCEVICIRPYRTKIGRLYQSHADRYTTSLLPESRNRKQI